ncbi:tRNA preQ1(34) S-adenosylmethionine ribosyltransferase-isomerase QueA [Thermotoga sp. KOL6]|uniref:tRNA preQ1(34) S-adenosylmethionine ribosyltransferase-isomerase QueA n=1 Tax=Thermotoga sp. KOL6 TaxID=126741 RepID=UPI000C7615DD|nr:tRNA preQ1(34) S-adenosylmethionine ribosyltransferase-isomerase QueA [Thermotoga sp. KOL6]PLV59289.1 S-adenosylmethionine:tRNA ribosyltransferase-isomerase [Thermotoga sp. KOL6]
MKVSEFDYELPPELIAQEPVEPRDSSRLMVLHRSTRRIEHRIFWEIVEYLNPGDLLVLNVSKVIPARLFGKKKTGANIEILLLERVENGVWKCLVRPGQKVKKGVEIIINGDLSAVCIERSEDGTRIMEFHPKDDEIIFEKGRTPLPPYIKKEVPLERYQTVYAKEEGSVAAPTAGLHFTTELMDKLKEKGVEFAEVILHVGIGTFRPVKAEEVEKHKMHEEFYRVPRETVKKIEETRRKSRRIVAVGTTTVRTLETIARLPKREEYVGKTDLFIYPPFEFKLVDALITNFHLPRSTLLMLVSAFAGKDFVMEAYREAVKRRYRFFSFGDAMLIL